ncbi:MAG: hypothetical protein UE295_00310 [Acutalibacteraceae bacterium]|nr:hypothetical protein [Acutalibacteraceae bacterium]
MNTKKVVNSERKKLDDEQMEIVTGGTDEYSFKDFFENESFDKELVDDGNRVQGK